MTLAEAVKYVFAAYAIIMVAILVYMIFVANRVHRLSREVALLNETLERRESSAR